jgi:hypothetical protein
MQNQRDGQNPAGGVDNVAARAARPDYGCASMYKSALWFDT